MPQTTMRIRPLRRSRGAALRVHQVPAPTPRPEPVHPAERRLRDAGGPDDRETFSCPCGCVFEAQVTASVGCPHCGGQQVW